MAELVVRNLKELTRTFSNAPADVNRAYRTELRTVAEPVKATAEQLAVSRIRRIGPVWSRMRVGITTKSVYVAPRKKGARGRARAKRPNLAPLLSTRALEPALRVNQERVEHDFEQMLDRLVTHWDSDGP